MRNVFSQKKKMRAKINNKKKLKKVNVFIVFAIIVIILIAIPMLNIMEFYKWEIKISHISAQPVNERYLNAIEQKKIYFLGVMGEGSDFPGLDSTIVINKYNQVIIDSTCDIIISNGQKRFKQFAFDYAKEFNLKMLGYIKTLK